MVPKNQSHNIAPITKETYKEFSSAHIINPPNKENGDITMATFNPAINFGAMSSLGAVEIKIFKLFKMFIIKNNFIF